MTDVGSRIRYFRKQMNKPLKVIALDTGVSQSFISKVETGEKKCSLELLDKICESLGITMGEFFAEGKNELSPLVHELVMQAKLLPTNQLEVVVNLAKAMVDSYQAMNEKAAIDELSTDPIADLPYLYLKLKALRNEKGLSIEQAAAGIDEFLSPEKLQAYEEGSSEIEPIDQDRIGKFYGVSWAFLTGRTNIRKGHAGTLPTIEAAHRTDDPTKPLPSDSKNSLNEFKKGNSLFYEKGDGNN